MSDLTNPLYVEAVINEVIAPPRVIERAWARETIRTSSGARWRRTLGQLGRFLLATWERRPRATSAEH